MEHRADPGEDVITIVAEPGTLTFATRKEWRELPESYLDELRQHETVLIFKGTESVFFLLKKMCPLGYPVDMADSYRLVRISMDENGKQAFFDMCLSKAETTQLMKNRLTLWG